MSRHPDGLTAARVVKHLSVMLGVATAMGLLVAGLAIPFAGVAGVASRNVANSMDTLPADLTTEPLSQRTRVLAADGTLIATIFDQNRVNVRLDQVSKKMRQAILAIEDARFYQHGALDVQGTLRAFITNQANAGVVQGGSSITQQLVKLTLQLQGTKEQRATATEESYARKFTELRYAIALEQKYSKQWILERYLNTAYFGDGAWGIESAARHFFSVPARRLNLNQAAALAGIVKNPTRYDPTNNPAENRERRDLVINRMADLGVISEKRADKVKGREVKLKITRYQNGCVNAMDKQASWFCDYVESYLLADDALGKNRTQRQRLLRSGGLTIHTTLDPRFQIAANRAVQERVFPTDQAIGGLAMVVPGTGEVRALAQSRPMGRDKEKGETFLNYVVPRQYGDSRGFQAGSTFKVFTLAAAIEDGVPLTTQISSPQTYTVPGETLNDCDDRGGYDDWQVNNSTGSGTFNLYSGTQRSVNTFFAQLEQGTGLCDPITLAEDMGVEVPDQDRVGPFTLGVTNTNPLTMAGAYATFAARGVYCEPRPVTQIEDSAGRVLTTYPDRCKQLVESSVADAVNDILRGVVEPGGFGAALAFGQPSAGKTGTIQDNKAVWFNGYTPDIAAAAMIAGANSLGQPITLNGQVVGGIGIGAASGSREAGPIWGNAMATVAPYLEDNDFTSPDAATVRGVLVTVPSLAGQDPQAALRVLRRAGFVPRIGPMVDSGYARGTVAYLSARAGSQIGTGSPVTIYVSDGTPAPKKKPRKNRKNRGNR